jgi:predicted permease
MMRRTPAFTLAAVLTLGVAIGINTAVFSVADAVLLRPLPYPNPDRLALVAHRPVGSASYDFAHNGRTWEAVRDGASTIERAVFSRWPTGVNLVAEHGGARLARHVTQQRVGARFFSVLGVTPLRGRDFNDADEGVGGPAVTILSAALWRSAFDSDSNVIGRPVTLRGQTFTVVGIMPDSFISEEDADLWTPLRATVDGEGGGENYTIVARLHQGVTWAEAIADVENLGRHLSATRPAGAPERMLTLNALQESLTADLRRPIMLLWGAVAVVLVVACINLAGLLLARSASRRREIATRMALGSDRRGVMRQLVAESVVLAAMGGLAGLFIGYAALQALQVLAEDAYEIWQPVLLDWRAITAAAILSLVASVCFGLGPAWHASTLDVQAGLRDAGGRGVAGARQHWPRQAVVIMQVALGIVLLVVAGLLVRTFVHLRNLNPGFDPENVVAASVSLQDARYESAARVSALFDSALRDISLLPGVDSAGVSLGLPYQRILNLPFRYVGQVRRSGQDRGITNAAYIAGDYFRALRIPVRRGRTFDARDTAGSPAVTIVNDAFVKTYFDDDPIGRRLAFGGGEREIVGVVGDVQVRPGWGNNGPLAPMPVAYIPVTQVSDGMMRLVHTWFSPVFVARAAGPLDQIAAGMRRAVDTVDPMLPFAEVQRMTEVRAASLARQRFLMALLVGLAATAVLLAAVGIHGLVATSVAERTREMGIRLALGSTALNAVRALTLPGLLLTGVGVVLGLAGAAAATRLVRHFVWGISATDPLTFAAVPALFLVIATVASLTPALRILKLDPAATLRD